MAWIQLHGPAQQLAGFGELHSVAADHAQVVEALHVVWLQLQPGKQQRDRLVVTAGLQMGGNGGSGWNLPRLGLPVHLDQPVAEPHIHPAASLAVGMNRPVGSCDITADRPVNVSSTADTRSSELWIDNRNSHCKINYRFREALGNKGQKGSHASILFGLNY